MCAQGGREKGLYARDIYIHEVARLEERDEDTLLLPGP